jgi:hypothetical protein
MAVKKVLARSARAPKLEMHVDGQVAAKVAAPQGDPKGFKTYAAWCVAYYIYPFENGVNVEQDISDNARTNADAIALDINYYSSKLAKQYSLTWSNVVPADVSTLTTVQTLEDLVIQHLA